MNELLAWGQQNLTTVGLLAAVGYYFWPQIRSIFAGGSTANGSKPQDEFLATVDSARDLIEHFEQTGDEEGAKAAREAAARLFTEQPKK